MSPIDTFGLVILTGPPLTVATAVVSKPAVVLSRSRSGASLTFPKFM